MSVSPLLTIGSRAMTANYAALQTTGNNVANANTAGYSRQSVELATAFSQQTGSGFFGKGVDVATVTRAHSDFLTREAATTRLARRRRRGAQQPAAAARDGLPDRRGRPRLRRAADASTPSSTSRTSRRTRRRARSCWPASATSRRAFAAPRDQIDSIQAGIAAGPAHGGHLDQCADDADRRPQPAASPTSQGTGHEPNDLLDQRDTAIADLSKIAQVTTVAAADGTVGVFLGGAQKLVLGGEATPLTALADPYDPAKVQIGITEGGTTRAFPDGFIAGGSVAGLLRVQNHDLGDARGLLGQLASAIAGSLNAAAGARPRPRPAPGPRRAAALGRRRVGGAVVEQRAGRRRSGRLVRQRLAACASRASRSRSSRPASCSRATTSSSPIRRCRPAAIG